jgi:hypothetical protein
MIIDGHAHAAREYSTAESIITTSKKYGLDKIVLCTSEPQEQRGLESATQCSVYEIPRQHLSP